MIEECYQQSVALLRENASRDGILASSRSGKAEARNYLSVFGRDASICALGMVASGDRGLIRTAGRGLRTLARFQAKNGQIPNYVKPGAEEGNFWHFGCIDATLWWLIAVKFYDRHSGAQNLLPSLEKHVGKALSWLACQEHPLRGLLVQNEASDWADIMPRSGHVLYSNALWYRVKKLYGIPSASGTRRQFNRVFFPFSPNGKRGGDGDRFYTIDAIRREVRPHPCYLSYVSYLSWGEEVDVYANVLSLLFGLADGRFRDSLVGFLRKSNGNGAASLPVTLNPIRKGSKQWRGYMERHNLNVPFQYHNGGIWPYIGCFWVMALAVEGRKALAIRELRKVAGLNQVNRWQFNEWFHGVSGRPMGMAGQSWNAATFLLAYHFVRDGLTV